MFSLHCTRLAQISDEAVLVPLCMCACMYVRVHGGYDDEEDDNKQENNDKRAISIKLPTWKQNKLFSFLSPPPSFVAAIVSGMFIKICLSQPRLGERQK